VQPGGSGVGGKEGKRRGDGGAYRGTSGGVRLGRESGELKRGNHVVSGQDIRTEVDDDDVA
jgi:hypothetical protein